jgi:hypothetical protein
LFRGKQIEIVITNPDHLNRGVREMQVNGDTVTGNIIPIDILKKENRVEITLRD